MGEGAYHLASRRLLDQHRSFASQPWTDSQLPLNRNLLGQRPFPEVVERSIENSLSFGVYKGTEQVGFARVVTDYATFAWIADVFILPAHRGRGLSKWLMELMIEHPQLQGFRRWVLATKDAHGLYERFGFITLHRPERWMERPDPNMKESPDYWQ